MKTIHDERYTALIALFKDRRKALGLRQQDVAASLGWPRSSLSRIESRERRLDIWEAFLLARTLGIKFRTVERELKGQTKGLPG